MENGGRERPGGRRKTGMMARLADAPVPRAGYRARRSNYELMQLSWYLASVEVGGVVGGPKPGAAKAHDGTVSQEP